MLKFIDSIPLPVLIILTLLMGMAPYPGADMPHLFEKLVMLSAGELNRPLDIFDLVLHALPGIVLIIRLFRLKNSSEKVHG